MYNIDLTVIKSMMFLFLILFCVAYSWIDIKLQITDEERIVFQTELCLEARRKAETNMIKVVDDLKNPILAIKKNKVISNLNSIDKDICKSEICTQCKQILKNFKYEIDFGTSDLLEMLEITKSSLKLGFDAEISQEKLKVKTHDMIKAICKTHKKLAINESNEFTVQVNKLFPKYLMIQRTLLQRVVNNVISYSLKNTYCGKVEVTFNQSSKVNELTDLTFLSNFIHVGCDIIYNYNYLFISIKDNGKGIAVDKVDSIFSEQQIDHSQINWYGTEQGLPICESLILKAGGFIRYWSKENIGTQFAICIPHQTINQDTDSYYQQTQLKIITTPKLSLRVHSCNEVILAEDNRSILKKYEKFYSKNNIPFQSFRNGRECYEYIKQIDCHKCSKSLILTDKMMPLMNGYEMAIQIKKLSSERTYIIALIISEEKEFNTECNNNFDYILIKPISICKLRQLHDNVYVNCEKNIQDIKLKDIEPELNNYKNESLKYKIKNFQIGESNDI